MSSGLERVRTTAKLRKKERFTALLHHVTIELLRDAYSWLKRDAAAGVDGVTWDDYGTDLEANLADLHARIHRGAYRAQPSRRVYIPKPDGRRRPLGIVVLEDKIVQRALAELLNAIYEEDFLGFSYAFRPRRSQHDALDALAVGIGSRKVNWILDADIAGFFDTVSHEWLSRFVEHRIGDQRVIRLIRKWLKAGVLEDNKIEIAETGTPQGAVISPLLANIYLHYVFDLWAERWRRRTATGDMIIVRYADDIVVGFQHWHEAERFVDELTQRLADFALQLNLDKTRLIEFGRHAATNRKGRGLGKPEVFELPWLHPHLWALTEGTLPAPETVAPRPLARQAARNQGERVATSACADRGAGQLAETCRDRLVRLSRRAGQWSIAPRLPGWRDLALAARAAAPWPARQNLLESDHDTCQPLAPTTAHPSSLARPTFCRHTSKVGAVCLNRARTVLCGGRAVMRVPTAMPQLDAI